MKKAILLAVGLIASLSLAHAGPKEDARQVVANWSKSLDGMMIWKGWRTE
jgi:hypothetical protein